MWFRCNTVPYPQITTSVRHAQKNTTRGVTTTIDGFSKDWQLLCFLHKTLTISFSLIVSDEEAFVVLVSREKYLKRAIFHCNNHVVTIQTPPRNYLHFAHAIIQLYGNLIVRFLLNRKAQIKIPQKFSATRYRPTCWECFTENFGPYSKWIS